MGTGEVFHRPLLLRSDELLRLQARITKCSELVTCFAVSRLTDRRFLVSMRLSIMIYVQYPEVLASRMMPYSRWYRMVKAIDVTTIHRTRQSRTNNANSQTRENIVMIAFPPSKLFLRPCERVIDCQLMPSNLCEPSMSTIIIIHAACSDPSGSLEFITFLTESSSTIRGYYNTKCCTLLA